MGYSSGNRDYSNKKITDLLEAHNDGVNIFSWKILRRNLLVKARRVQSTKENRLESLRREFKV